MGETEGKEEAEVELERRVFDPADNRGVEIRWLSWVERVEGKARAFPRGTLTGEMVVD